MYFRWTDQMQNQSTFYTLIYKIAKIKSCTVKLQFYLLYVFINYRLQKPEETLITIFLFEFPLSPFAFLKCNSIFPSFSGSLEME